MTSALTMYDMIVCGGGMAGFAAACAAAEQGARTLLVERLGVLGGLGSAGGVGCFCFADGPPRGQGMVFEAVWNRLAAYGAIGEENGWPVGKIERYHWENHSFDHAVLPWVLQELSEEFGVHVLLDTDVVDARADGSGHVERLVLLNRSLRQEVAAKFFVDGTGDGVMARLAGAEALPVDASGLIKPSFMVYLRRAEHAALQTPPSRRRYGGGDGPAYSIWREPHGRIGLKLSSLGEDFDTGSGEGLDLAEKAFRSRIPEAVRHFQEHHEPHYVFDFAAPMLGVREGRRVKGDYVLNVVDVRAGRKFPDGVAFGVFGIDTGDVAEIVPPYQIPYRSLLAHGLDNVLVVGRCFSADRLALSSARIMATCCLMGQAAGIAGALACDGGVALRGVAPGAIRAALLEKAANGEFLRKHLCPDVGDGALNNDPEA